MSDHPSEPDLRASPTLKQELKGLVCMRMHNLRDMHKYRKSENKLDDLFSLEPESLRKLEKQRFHHDWRLENMTDAEVVQEAVAARQWLLVVLECQGMIMAQDQEIRVITLAIKKQLKGLQTEWTDKERLYIALTEISLSSPRERLQAAHVLALHRNLMERLQDISKAAAIHNERMQRKPHDTDGFLEVLQGIMDRAHASVVDHFACAIPLSQLSDASDPTVMDDNAMCCPICQHSYSNLSEFSVEELLDDYPVRIKHCGHVVGKACLERWMDTPKIDEAKYPYRTCPLCRVKVEGVKDPAAPRGLKEHLKKDRRAMEALFELTFGFGMDREDSVVALLSCMSEEIACTELLHEVEHNGGDKESVMVLTEKLEELQQEKRVWGFRGDGAWIPLRKEWVDSGVARRV
ncbi:hypothetical protein yc1106_00110 [Curvularia clavata]|uniref:RING-type domain-containing protein n=1 Tax=Curvularia clavata TaxID=95742 RepID=A0A9Q8YZ84_CURCL|nr:hypothetical protein yc1106_00110 [Curvularia clavata]